METVSAEVIRAEIKTKKESVSTGVDASKRHGLFRLFSQEWKCTNAVPQILAIVIGGHIVDMYLVTFLEYTKHTLWERIHTLLKEHHAFQNLERFFLGKGHSPHVPGHFSLETTYLFRNLCFGWTPQSQSPSPWLSLYIILNQFSTVFSPCALTSSVQTNADLIISQNGLLPLEGSKDMHTHRHNQLSLNPATLNTPQVGIWTCLWVLIYIHTVEGCV